MLKGKIIFIGGIHGVGKGTFCNKIIEKLEFEHLSASKVLKWEELSDVKNKKVKNFETTQERLIHNLNKIVDIDKRYLLDGHFTLLNSENKPHKIDIDTFIGINPHSIILIKCNPKIISERLNNRDDSFYSIELLTEMQNLEIEHAKNVSERLNIPLLIVEKDSELVYKHLENI